MAWLNPLITILTVAGALGVFLYGMKLMSESLQKVAGEGMRKFFTSMTSHPVKGVVSGLVITAAVQSSSAITVLIVSFVNAGLISLFQSVSLIMGANIGTTSTAWLVSYIGFKFDLTFVLLPMIGLSLPLLFSKKQQLKNWGEFVFGFCLIFLGLNFLKSSIPVVTENSYLVQYIKNFNNSGILSYIIFFIFGVLLTILLRSSAASMVLTFIMCSNGWISFPLATVMVVGDNVGTTLTANIAAFVANAPAKRAALFHFVFNAIGAVWSLLFLHFFLSRIAALMQLAGADSPFTNVNTIPTALAIFHSGFNIINTILLIGFIPYIIRLTEKIIPVHDEEKESSRLQYIETMFLNTPELSLLQTQKAITVFAGEIRQMFALIPQLLIEKRNKKYSKLLLKIEKYENTSDTIEIEIAEYLIRISAGDISQPSSHQVRNMLKVINDLENMSDICWQMARTIDNKNRQNIWFTQEMRDNLTLLFTLVDEALALMITYLDGEYFKKDFITARNIEKQINELRTTLLADNIVNINKRKYSYRNGNCYSELISQSEKLADYIISVQEAISGSKTGTA
ncbi:MAG: Na/Pi cotransporter family protein [Lentimicrobiaceae bacterium]|nr:Na/Pi cotransporter family protein [Lentimicrobiaceae bacterium]